MFNISSTKEIKTSGGESDNTVSEKIAICEHTEENVKIDLEFCKNICSREIAMYIVNTEEKIVHDMVSWDLSSLLLHKVDEKGNVCFEYKWEEFSKMCPLMSVHFEIEVDKD